MIQIRYTKRQNRLYIDYDSKYIAKDRWLVIECYRALNPADNNKIYNDSFLKRYVTAQIKKQWGQNLIKFNGVQLPGGVSLNGEKMYEDGKAEVADIEERMQSEYELPPNFLIG
jgi:hypothetical protein